MAVLSFYYINRDLARKAIAQKELEYLNSKLNKTNEEVTENKNELYKRNYLLSGVMEINDLMRGENDLTSLSNKILRHICQFMKVQVGTIYILNDDGNFHLMAIYGVESNESIKKIIQKGEGLLGQAALDFETRMLEDVSPEHLKIQTSLISLNIFHSLIIYFHYNNETVALI